MSAGAARPAGFRSASWISDCSYENHTSYPAPGQIILYPGGISETEILLAYGAVQFASKMGQLAGNHFLTVMEGGSTWRRSAAWCCGRAPRTSSLRPADRPQLGATLIIPA